MTEKKTWKEFRDSGMLWWINMILHTFGWSIAVEIDERGVIVDAYPTRCKFRGFTEKLNDEGYQKVTKYVKENIDELEQDCNMFL